MKGLHAIDTALGPVQAAFDASGAVIYLGFADHEFRAPLLAKVARLEPVQKPSTQAMHHLQGQLAAAFRL